MKIEAAKKTVICTPVPEDKTSSGIVLAQDDDKEKKPEMGIVYSIGKGHIPVPMEIGDTIIFRRYASNHVYVKGTSFNFVDFGDVVGVIRN